MSVRITKLVLHNSGFRQLRSGPEVEKMLRGHVDNILADVGDGYEGDVVQGKTRLRGGVVTATAEAMADNAANNTLVNALARARG